MSGFVIRICLVALACVVQSVAARADGRLLVEIDRAHIMRLSEAAGSIILGNPAIADAAVQDARTLVLTGKSVGSTNIIILDADGGEVLNQIIEVMPLAGEQMTMYKGAARQSYACAPKCEPKVQLGDDATFFKNALETSMAKSDQAAPK